MPFTLSHAAAALPFRRLRLVPSALVVGTFGPDLEYFIRMHPGGGYGHTLRGAFLLSLPLGLIVLWLFHRFVKRPAVMLMPVALERRLAPWVGESSGEFRFLPWPRFVLICASMLLGIATHILWDSFTHHHTWLYAHWKFLHRVVHLGPYFSHPWYVIFQWISSILGCGLLLAWFVHWYRTHAPSPYPASRPLSTGVRTGIIAFMVVLAIAAGYGRWRLAMHHHSLTTMAADALVAFIAALWWQLVVMGVVLRNRGSLRQPLRHADLAAGFSERER